MTWPAAVLAVAVGAISFVIFDVAADVSWDLSGFLAVLIFVIVLAATRVTLLRRAR